MGYEQLEEPDELVDSSHLLDNRSSRTLPVAQFPMKARCTIVAAITLLVGFLYGLNVTTIIGLIHMKEGKSANPYASPMSTEEKLQTFQTLTEYSSDDLSTANAAWAKFVVNGFVALPQSWVADSQWPAAREMPGDEEKGIYVVDGFHQLHCVMHIRNTMSDLLNGKPVQNYTHTLRHLNHCYDALRQAIICRADDTPLYVPLDTFFAGNGQQRRCRNWDALEDWVVRHTACYDPVRC